MQRREFAAALGAALAMGACKKAEPRKLVVASTPYLSMAPLHLALERKHFEAAGFEIQHERLSNSSQSIAALAGGQLDVSFTTPNAGLINAVVRGAKVRLVAGREYLKPGCGTVGSMLIRKKSFPNGLTAANLADLKGKKISISIKSTGTSTYLFYQLLEKGGLEPKDVQAVSIATSEEPVALSKGLIDAAASSSGLDAIPAELGAQLEYVSPAAELYAGFQWSFIAFGSRLVEGDPSIGARFLAIYHRAVREYLDGAEPAFVREYAEKAKLDLAAVRGKCRANVSTDGALDLKSIQSFADWAARKGYADRALKAEEIADTRFVEAARRIS